MLYKKGRLFSPVSQWHITIFQLNYIQFSAVTQSCPTLCNPTDCSTPGFPVHHQLLELAQIHVHRVSDTVQASQPLSSPFSPAFNLSQHLGLFKWVRSLHQVAKVLEFQIQYQSFQWIFSIDFFLGLTGLISFQGTLKSLLQHYSSKASILCCSDFFIVQLSHPKMTTGKTIALAKWTFVGKVMSLLSNMLSRLVIAFLPRSVSFGFMTTVTICSNFGAQEHKVCHCFHFSPSICHEVMGTNAMILVILTLSFKPAFSLSSFTLIHRLFPWNVQEIVYLEKKINPVHCTFFSLLCFFFSEFCLFSLF